VEKFYKTGGTPMEGIAEYLAPDYPRKGSKKRRIRELKKWTIINRVLYGCLLAEKWTVADLAERMKVSSRTVDGWIFEGRIPRKDRIDKLCNVFNISENLLFNEMEIDNRKLETQILTLLTK
jgi:transcriptional regulator with XRE-family HTH domain